MLPVLPQPPKACVLPGDAGRVLCEDLGEGAVSGGLAGGENGGPWLDEHEDC